MTSFDPVIHNPAKCDGHKHLEVNRENKNTV